MVSATHLFVSISAFGLIAASPLRNQARQYHDPIKVPCHRNPGYHAEINSAAMKAYMKYNIPVPAKIKAAAKKAMEKPGSKGDNGGLVNNIKASGKAVATSQSDVVWLTPVTIGGKTLNMNLDTGSSDFWVYADENHPDAKGKAIYDCSHGDKGLNWKVTYVDESSASGHVAFDKVSIGGITVAQQAVGCATEISNMGDHDTSDGILGLGFKNGNNVQAVTGPFPQNPWIDNAFQQRVVGEGVFTADLWRLDERESSYTFGECTCEETPRWVDVDHTSGYYKFPGVNGKPAIADTGTTLLLVEPSLLTIYYGRIKGAEQDEEGHWMFPCDAGIPNLLLPIHGENVRIPSALMKFTSRGDGKCYGSLQSNQGSGVQIYGDVLMKAVTACFDHVNKKFGYCPKSKNPRSPPKSSSSASSTAAATSTQVKSQPTNNNIEINISISS